MRFSPQDSKSGMSLVSVMVAVAISGVVAVGIVQIVTNGISGVKSIELRQDIEVIKGTLISRMDCRNTLGITSTTVLPVACPSVVTLLMRNGQPMAPNDKLGVWSVSPSCVNSEILIGVSKPGKDPLTGRSWSSSPASTDVFQGLSDLCREYLDASFSSCTASYPLRVGIDNQGARCCRQVPGTPIATVGGLNHSRAFCSAGEIVVGGGGGCNLPAPSGIEERGFLQNVGIDYTQNAYYADCHGNTMTPAQDAPARTWAVCCPL